MLNIARRLPAEDPISYPRDEGPLDASYPRDEGPLDAYSRGWCSGRPGRPCRRPGRKRRRWSAPRRRRLRRDYRRRRPCAHQQPRCRGRQTRAPLDRGRRTKPQNQISFMRLPEHNVWPDANYASSLTGQRLSLYLYGLVALLFSATGAHAEGTFLPFLLQRTTTALLEPLERRTLSYRGSHMAAGTDRRPRVLSDAPACIQGWEPCLATPRNADNAH
jgi:hypothetical protein